MKLLRWWVAAFVVAALGVIGLTFWGVPPSTLNAQSNAAELVAKGVVPPNVMVGEMPEMPDMTGMEMEPRVVEISMREWGFAGPDGTDTIMAGKGEPLILRVRNDGAIPHEFMVMTMEQMMAQESRLERADFLLEEHEALTEVAILVPGQTVDVPFTPSADGMYMFMCMYPWHMQLGMMGSIMVGDMGSMPGM